MIVKDSGAPPGSRSFSLEEQASALALILRDEFGIPFRFYETTAGSPVSIPDAPAGGEEGAAGEAGRCLTPAAVIELAGDGRARVTPLAEDRYQLALLLHEAGRPVLAAAGEMAGLARTVREAIEERLRLQKWLQAVSDRLRMADQVVSRRRHDDDQAGQVHSAWEAALTAAHLTRAVRIHREPVRNRQRILEAAFGLLGAQTLVWVPQQLDGPVLSQGDALLAPADCRQLAAALSQHPGGQTIEPVVLNDFQKTSGGGRFVSVVNLMAFLVTDQGPVGWVIALNKKAAARGTPAPPGPKPAGDLGAQGIEPAPFRRSDAALLTPFVALLELHARAARRYHDLKDLLVGLARSLTAALDAKDSYTYGHSERVARIAVELGRELALEGEELADVYLAGLLHDVGKIGIRDAVLGKMEPLTPEEFEHIKRHVTIGYSILSDLRQIRNLLPGVLYHHERWDGGGYPEGLAGEAIPLLARILAVADAYDAMSTTRPYRDALPCRRVEEILHEGAGTQWDQRVVDAFLRCRQKIHTIRQRGVGESLLLAIDGALRIDNSLAPWKSDMPPPMT